MHISIYVCIYVSASLFLFLIPFTGAAGGLSTKSNIEDFSASHLISKKVSSCSSQRAAVDKNLRTLIEIKHSISTGFCQIT